MKHLPASFRTDEGEAAYQRAKQRGELRALEDEYAFIQWKHWKLIPNRFPGDAIFSVHDMLIPLRVFPDRDDMSLEEMVELEAILHELENQYTLHYENFASGRSVKSHYHIHLVRIKKR